MLRAVTFGFQSSRNSAGPDTTIKDGHNLLYGGHARQELRRYGCSLVVCKSDLASRLPIPDGTRDPYLTTYGSTDQSTCSSPCFSLSVRGRSGLYRDLCDFIEAELWDAWDPVHKDGNRRGTEIMIHAQAPNNSGVAYDLPPTQWAFAHSSYQI